MATILVDLLHPAHYHFFSPAIRRWRDQGHRVVLTAREKDILLELLQEERESATVVSKLRHGRFGQACELLQRVARFVPLLKRERVDVITSVAGVGSAHAGWLLRIPSLVWTNNENARVSNRLTLPFASSIATPTSFPLDYGARHLRYRGNHERSYVSLEKPEYPREQLQAAGIDCSRPYAVIRLVSWQAAHDRGHHGLSVNSLREFLEQLESGGVQIVLSIEGEPPPQLRGWVRALPVNAMRAVLAHARFYLGEGATMGSEAALMGVPNIFFSTIRLGYLNELEEHGLMVCSADWAKVTRQIHNWLADPDLAATWRARRNHFFDTTDPVADLVHDWVLERISGPPHQIVRQTQP